MALYLFQATYTSESWAAQIKNPRDVRERVQAAAAQLGGRLIDAWYSFGEYDFVAIVEYPDNLMCASASMVVAASGGLKSLKTTPILAINEGMGAMEKAGIAAGLYQPPQN